MIAMGEIEGRADCAQCEEYVNDLIQLMHSARSLADRRLSDGGFRIRPYFDNEKIVKKAKVIDLPDCNGSFTFYHKDDEVWGRKVDCLEEKSYAG